MEFGETNIASRVVYILVGVCAIYWIPRLPALLNRADRADGKAATAS